MPEDWGENEEIHLMWDSDSEGLLYTSEGGILQGFLGEDSDRKRYVYIMKRDKVRNDFVDGKVQYFIEMSCMKFKGCTFEDGADTWPLGVNMDEYFPLKVAQIAIFNREAWDILYDYIVVKDSALLLEPTMSSRADEALVTANRMTDICSPLDNTTYPKTHLEAERFLSSPNSSAQHEVYAVGHCHIDAGWLWPFWETHRKTARSWSCQMRLFENYPQFNFCNSSAIFYEWMKADYPDLFAEIKSRHAEGRFEVVGGTYLEMDGNLPSGESFARQFLYGQRFFKANFGKYLEVFFMPDTFGYSAQLPQYMAQSKIKYFMTNKISWNVFNTFPHTTFYWEGIDGSKVFSHFPPARGCSLHGEVAEVLKSQTQNLDKGRTNKSLFLFGLGDGGGGPHDYMIERLTRMSDCCGIPKVHFSSVLKFFEDAQATAHDLFTWQGELYLEKHNGTYTTIAKNKKNNRECEYLVRDMEYLSSLEFFYTGNYPQALLDRIWKDMMKDQFHDVIPGTSISMIYDITDKDYASIREKTESNITNSTLAVLQEAVGVSNPLSFVDTEGEGNAYSLLNTGMHEREYLYWSEADSAYKNINVGGLTAHVITKSDVDALPVIQGQVKVTEGEGTLLVENDYYLITFTTEGRVSSLLDKETGEYALESTYRENIAPPTLQSSSYLQHGNTFCIHQDTPPMWDAWDVWIYNLDTHNLLKANNYSYVHKGHILQLTFNITISDKSTITQVVTVAKDSRRIDFHTQVEWHEMHKWLRVYFPLNVYADHATFDIQGGLLSRTTTTNTSWYIYIYIYINIYIYIYRDVAKYEVCAHHFGDISDNEYGFALLNNCKYGYSARANVLGLSLLKSSKGPWDQADMGIHNFTYSIYPHIGNYIYIYIYIL